MLIFLCSFLIVLSATVGVLNFLCFCTIYLFAPPLGSAVTVHHGLFDQAEFAEFHRVSQMHDPSMQEETVNLLGEEGLRAGGQAMKLG